MVTINEAQNGIVVIALKGKFSGTDEDRGLYDLVRSGIEQGRRRLVIDFSELKWANSAGIGIIVSSYLTARRGGGDLRMACVNDKVRHYFKISKLDSVFAVFDSVQDAVESFAETAEQTVPV